MEGRYSQSPFVLPGTGVRYARDRQVDMRQVRLDLEVDLEGRTLSGTAVHRFQPLREGLRRLALDAVEMEILDVREPGAEALPFVYDGRTLTVEFPSPLLRDREAEVEIRYLVREPRRGFYFVAPDEGYPDRPLMGWSQGQDEDSRYWWPCYDYPNGRATSEVKATVPEGFFALSNGTLVSRTRSEDGREVFHWRHAVPHPAYLVTLAVGRFSLIEEQVGGVPLLTCVVPGREEEARRAVEGTGEMLRLFAEKTGVPYPYEKYAQVFVAEFIFGGMENSSATTLTDESLRDERAALDSTSENLVAHELAHQWFGDLVTCRDWSQAWLNEGFATFMEVVWKEHRRGRDEACWHLAELAKSYREEARERYVRPIVCRHYDAPIDLFDAHLYRKGAWVLHGLRSLLGEEDFWASVRRYLEDHREEGVVEVDDLRRAVECVTGRNLEEYFDQWIKGAGIPALEMTARWIPEEGRLEVLARQTQEGEGVAKAFSIQTEIALASGEDWVRRPFRMDGRETAARWRLPGPPEGVAFDPDWTFLHDLTFPRPTEWVVHQMLNGPTAASRADAAPDLARDGSRRAVEALRAALLDEEESWGVRAAAAKALGRTPGPGSLDALRTGLGAGHPKVRRATARALGSHPGEEACASLAGLLEAGDESYFVEAEAARAVGRTRAEGAWEVLMDALGRESWSEVIRARTLEGLAELGDPRGVESALEWSAYGSPSRARIAAVSALGKMGWADPPQRRSVRLRLEELLADPSFRVRLAAAEALGDLGEPEAVASLRAVAERTRDGRIRRTARESLRRIEEGGSASARTRALQDSLDEARERIASLSRRVEALEALREGNPPAEG